MQKSLDWELKQNDDKITLQFRGELSRNTLLPLWSQRVSFLSAQKNSDKPIIWDLAEVERLDSAGFALLCDLLAETQQLNMKVQLENSPKQVEILADLFDLSNWIAPFLQVNGND